MNNTNTTLDTENILELATTVEQILKTKYASEAEQIIREQIVPKIADNASLAWFLQHSVLRDNPERSWIYTNKIIMAYFRNLPTSQKSFLLQLVVNQPSNTNFRDLIIELLRAKQLYAARNLMLHESVQAHLLQDILTTTMQLLPAIAEVGDLRSLEIMQTYILPGLNIDNPELLAISQCEAIKYALRNGHLDMARNICTVAALRKLAGDCRIFKEYIKAKNIPAVEFLLNLDALNLITDMDMQAETLDALVLMIVNSNHTSDFTNTNELLRMILTSPKIDCTVCDKAMLLLKHILINPSIPLEFAEIIMQKPSIPRYSANHCDFADIADLVSSMHPERIISFAKQLQQVQGLDIRNLTFFRTRSKLKNALLRAEEQLLQNSRTVNIALMALANRWSSGLTEIATQNVNGTYVITNLGNISDNILSFLYPGTKEQRVARLVPSFHAQTYQASIEVPSEDSNADFAIVKKSSARVLKPLTFIRNIRSSQKTQDTAPAKGSDKGVTRVVKMLLACGKKSSKIG